MPASTIRQRLLSLAAGTLLLALLACDSAGATPTAGPAPSPVPPTPAGTVQGPSPVLQTPVPTASAVPPTETAALPTETAIPPTETAALPTETAVPPTETVVPPTETAALPTAILAPPTATPVPPTATARRATPTAAPPQATPTAPAATNPPPATPDPQIPAGRVPGDLSQVIVVPPGKHRIALTFDAGAGRGHIPEILAALSRYNAHITFFITGAWADENPDMLRAIVAAGHEVANHSYSHPSFVKLTDAEMIAELGRAEAAITKITGVTTRPYWRPPFGDENAHVLAVAQSQGYRSIFWTLDSLDSVGKVKTKDFIVKRLTETAWVNLDGAIMLEHVASDPSAAALPEILDRLYAKGLRVVTISELLSP